MALLSYRRHRFPPPIIQHAIWLYLRFTLSYRDVEELLAERGLEVSYETVRRWVLKFGSRIARRLRRSRPRPTDRWHLDEMVVRIAGRQMYLWRAVDHEGEVLDMLVQRRRRCPQHVQSSTPPHFPIDTADLPSRSDGRMAGGCRRCINLIAGARSPPSMRYRDKAHSRGQRIPGFVRQRDW